MVSPKEFESFEDFLRRGGIGEDSRKEATIRTYLYAIKTFERYLGERTPTPELAKEFVADLKKTNSPSSLNVHIGALVSYFHFLGQELTIPRFQTYRDYPPTLSEEEWQHLLTTATEHIHDTNWSEYGRFRSLYELCVLYVYCDCGLRPSEAISLKVEDVLSDGYLRVTHPDGKSDRVPISGPALNYIKDYVYYRGNQEPYLFAGEKLGTPIAYRTAQGIINRLYRRAGLPDARARNLRYRIIQQLRKIGISGEEIKAKLESETA